MTLNANTTVRELALEMPQATRIFERLKIDYCCGGARPLSAACADAEIECRGAAGTQREGPGEQHCARRDSHARSQAGHRRNITQKAKRRGKPAPRNQSKASRVRNAGRD